MPNSRESGLLHTETGFRSQPTSPSLSEVHRTLVVPSSAGFFRKLFAFAGPGFLVAVGYMDPGNWATDLAGGSKYSFSLLSVIMLSNLMAIVLQALSLKLGIVTGRDLAQACRDHYSRPVSLMLWVLCEIAIAACDLAEVIGSAIALNLLFGVPLIWGVVATALDVLVILVLQQKGFRWLEAVVLAALAERSPGRRPAPTTVISRSPGMYGAGRAASTARCVSRRTIRSTTRSSREWIPI